MADIIPPTFWADRVAVAMTMLAAYDAAILALIGGAQSYQLDTGQTRTLVSKVNLASLRIARDGLLNEISTLEARARGASTRIVPNF
jgi:hypothetical protein